MNLCRLDSPHQKCRYYKVRLKSLELISNQVVRKISVNIIQIRQIIAKVYQGLHGKEFTKFINFSTDYIKYGTQNILIKISKDLACRMK